MTEIEENKIIDTEMDQTDSGIDPTTVPERIDQTQDLQFSEKEIRDFIFDKNNQKENIKDLCDYLEMEILLGIPKYIQQGLLKDIRDFFEADDTQKMFSEIKSKVKGNIELNEDEKSIIYLELMINGYETNTITKGTIDFKNKIKNAKKPFDPHESTQQICDGIFLEYIQNKYNNLKYYANNYPYYSQNDFIIYNPNHIFKIQTDDKEKGKKIKKEEKLAVEIYRGKIMTNKEIERNGCNPEEVRKLVYNKQEMERLDKLEPIINTRGKATSEEKEKIKGNEMYEIGKNGSIIFTEKSNGEELNKAIEGLPIGQKYNYKIDYSDIDTSDSKGKGESIKENAISKIGSATGRLSYDQDTKKYTLRDSEGEPIDYCVLTRKGVKLIPEEIIKKEAQQELQIINQKEYENLCVTPKGEKTAQLKKMLNTIPSAKKKLTQEEQNKLMEKTEKRILYLLKKAKELGYEIKLQEPVTKIWIGNGHMELHLIDPKSFKSVSRTIREDENTNGLGKNLYDFIDGHEGDYETYLTDLVKDKRIQLDSLTKHNKIDLSGEDCLSIEQQLQMLNGMYLLKETLEIERNRSSDKFLTAMCVLLGDGIWSLENSYNISEEKVTKNLIDRLWGLYESYKSISPLRSIDETGLTTDNYAYTQAKNNFYDLFWGNENGQRKAIRTISAVATMSPGGFDSDQTSSSHLENDIINKSFEKDKDGEYKHKFQINGKEENNCINKIYDYEIKLEERLFDETGNLTPEGKTKVKSIDEVFKAAEYDDTNPNIYVKHSFINYLVSIGILPGRYRNAFNDSLYSKKIVNVAIKLKNKLNSIRRQLDNFPKTAYDLAEIDHKEKLRLEAKGDNKTEEERKRLQILENLENNPLEQYRINQIKINMMKAEFKYGCFGQGLASLLFEPLAELGGGAKGYGADIFNDITGIGLRNLSDENAAFLGTMIEEIAITVMVAIVTQGIGTAATLGVLNTGARIARGARWVNLANRIAKVIEISSKAYKDLTIAGKFVKGTFTATSLLIEGTTFNAVSDIIHATINGTSLDDINLNPLARENIQTAAFLGMLSCFGELGNAVAGGATKLAIDPAKGFFDSAAEGLIGLFTEAGKMLLAEQTMNIIFGHDIIDPKTGEVKKERFHLPTQQEIMQMIGMILAFKAVKPGIRQNYAYKLSVGTLEICRSTIVNEFVIREVKTGKIVEIINNESIKLESNKEKKPSKQEKETKTKNKKQRNKDYFDGQPHEFDVTPEQAIENSQCMDNILENINEGNIREELDNLKKRISKQYHEATGENLELSDEQLLGILDAHEQDGILGQLTRPQLARKVKILALTISDNKVRRFLLEAGFCGKTENSLKLEDYTRKLKNNRGYSESTITEIINFTANGQDTGRLRFIEQITRSWVDEGNIKELLNLYNEGKITPYKYELIQEQLAYYAPKYIRDYYKSTYEIKEAIKKISELESLGMRVSSYDFIEYEKKYGELNFNYEKIKKIADLCGGLHFSNFKEIENFINKFNNTEIDFEKLQKLKEKFGIKINEHNIKELSDIEINFGKLSKIKELGVEINERNIKKLSNVEIDFEKLNKIKELGVEINKEKIFILNLFNFEKLKKLIELGVEFNFSGAENKLGKFCDYEFNFTKLNKLKQDGFNISDNPIEFNEIKISEEEILLCKKYGITHYGDVKLFLTNYKNVDRGKIIDYIKRKNEYLQKNRTISEQKFIELFGGIGKFGKAEINQKYLGLCYYYTGMEALKKTNGFNVIIQTNLRETPNGREVRIPFCDPEGIWIKVNKNEIDQIISVPQKNGTREQLSINSKSEFLGFKILEIAFMKKEIINRYEQISESAPPYGYWDLKTAYNQYIQTGDMTLTGDLVSLLEGGTSLTIMPKIMLREKYYKPQGINSKDGAFDLFSKGQYSISLTYHEEFITSPDIYNYDIGGIIVEDVLIINKSGEALQWKYSIDKNGNIKKENDIIRSDIIRNESGGFYAYFYPHHAYSIEKCYIDSKTGQKRVWVVNPHHTGIKFDISLEECKKIFDSRTLTTMDIDAMFR